MTIRFPFSTRTNDVEGDYDIFKEILGKGISGKVYRCQHRATKRQCALKVLIDSDKARREVILHKRACESCRYIVQVLDVYENIYEGDYSILIIMECMEGGELFDRIKQRDTHPYTEYDAARYISMIVQAVAHLHSMDIAHRDLKPENLLLTSEENDALLKLGDFGSAKEGNNQNKPLKTPHGTPNYIAPEILSRENYDKACDIWSMGVIMYILLCGYPPFYCEGGGDSLQQLIKAGQYEFDGPAWEGVSNEAKSIIKLMLTVDANQRITIGEIANCSWLKEPASERPIDISSLADAENRNQIESEFASAMDAQRLVDEDDADVDIGEPDASRLMRRRNAI